MTPRSTAGGIMHPGNRTPPQSALPGLNEWAIQPRIIRSDMTQQQMSEQDHYQFNQDNFDLAGTNQPAFRQQSRSCASYDNNLNAYNNSDLQNFGGIVPVDKNFLPQLRREGYSCTPSLEAMQNMSEEQLASIENFIVARDGFGYLEWPGITDVRGLDLDYLVEISKMSCTVRSCDSLGDRRDVLKKRMKVALIVPGQQEKNGKTLDPQKIMSRLKQLTEKGGNLFSLFYYRSVKNVD